MAYGNISVSRMSNGFPLVTQRLPSGTREKLERHYDLKMDVLGNTLLKISLKRWNPLGYFVFLRIMDVSNGTECPLCF